MQIPGMSQLFVLATPWGVAKPKAFLSLSVCVYVCACVSICCDPQNIPQAAVKEEVSKNKKMPGCMPSKTLCLSTRRKWYTNYNSLVKKPATFNDLKDHMRLHSDISPIPLKLLKGTRLDDPHPFVMCMSVPDLPRPRVWLIRHIKLYPQLVLVVVVVVVDDDD